MKLTSFKENIPILIVFKALGIECEQVKNSIENKNLKNMNI